MAIPYHAQIWVPGYVRQQFRRCVAPRRLWVVIADHFEPWNMNREGQADFAMVHRWCREWPKIASRHRDSAGRAPQYAFFYPAEQYHQDLLEPLRALVQEGIADVEVHIHHDGDTETRFCERMRGFVETLHSRHGFLRLKQGKLQFAFIHGNWALDNSRPDGRWCGLNNEILLLQKLGCYADFTLPSAPHPTQTRVVNTVYWAVDDPLRPKSHDRGIPVCPGCPEGDLLMVPGPLGFNFRGGRRLPRLETGEIAWYDPPVLGRTRSWIRLAPRIGGDIILKLFTHGAQTGNAEALLNGGLDALFEDLTAECERQNLELHYASPWAVRLVIDGLSRGAELGQETAQPLSGSGSSR